MLHRLSAYTLASGTMARVVEDLRAALAQAPPEAASCLGAWTSEFGALNRLYCLWAHEPGATALEPERDVLVDRIADSRNGPLVEVEHMVLKPMRWYGTAPDDTTLFDFRVYDLKPGAGDFYLRKFAEVLPVREKHSRSFAIWRPVAGNPERVVHLWPYRSLEHRLEVRNAVAAEPGWKDYVSQVFPILVKQRSSLLRPVPLTA